MLDKTDLKDQYIQMFLYLIFHNSLGFFQLPAPQYLIFLANRWLLQHALQSVRLWLSLICLIILINYFCKCQKSSAHILLFKKIFEDLSSKYVTEISAVFLLKLQNIVTQITHCKQNIQLLQSSFTQQIDLDFYTFISYFITV